MSDNVVVADYYGNAASLAADEITIGGQLVKVPRVKIALGAANAYDMDLDSGQQTMATSLPVVLPSDQEVSVSGSLVISPSHLGYASAACSLSVLSKNIAASTSSTVTGYSGTTNVACYTATVPIRGPLMIFVDTTGSAWARISASLELSPILPAVNGLGPLWSGSIVNTRVLFVPSMTNASALIATGMAGCTIALPGLFGTPGAVNFTFAASMDHSGIRIDIYGS